MREISVVIPAKKNVALLGRGLGALCEQTLGPSNFEVCVVSRGSEEVTAKVVSLVNTHYPKHRVFMVSEEHKGSAQARNTGVKNTTAPLVVQSDEAAMPPPDWLEKFISSFQFQSPEVGKIGGNIIPVWGSPPPPWLTEGMLPFIYAASGLGSKASYVSEGLLESNCCYKRDALEAAGYFPTTRARMGLISTERAIDKMMSAKGWKLYYEPHIAINQNIPADYLTPLVLRQRYFWQGISDYAMNIYLKQHGIEVNDVLNADELPLDRSYWTFINNGNEPPREDQLNRLRILGFALARSGFIPTN